MCQTHGERGPGGQIQGHPRPTLWEHRWELGMTDPPPRVHPAPSSQGPSSPEGSSGRRLFLATSASAPKPRPTARPARRGLRALGICLGTGHVPIAPPPTRPGAAPEIQPRFPGSLADTPDTLGRRWQGGSGRRHTPAVFRIWLTAGARRGKASPPPPPPSLQAPRTREYTPSQRTTGSHTAGGAQQRWNTDQEWSWAKDILTTRQPLGTQPPSSQSV